MTSLTQSIVPERTRRTKKCLYRRKKMEGWVNFNSDRYVDLFCLLIERLFLEQAGQSDWTLPPIHDGHCRSEGKTNVVHVWHDLMTSGVFSHVAFLPRYFQLIRTLASAFIRLECETCADRPMSSPRMTWESFLKLKGHPRPTTLVYKRHAPRKTTLPNQPRSRSRSPSLFW